MKGRHTARAAFSIFACLCAALCISACSNGSETEAQPINSVIKLNAEKIESDTLNTDETPQILYHHIINNNEQADEEQPESKHVTDDNVTDTEQALDKTDTEAPAESEKDVIEEQPFEQEDIYPVIVDELEELPPESGVSESNEPDSESVQPEATETPVQQQTVETYISGAFPLYNYNYMSGEYLGRMRIPSVGIDIAFYNSNTQATCDAEDSAMFFYGGTPYDYYNYTIISGDHTYQGFNAIKNCTIGTVLYLDCKDGNTYKYVCDCVDYNGRHCDTYPYFVAGDGHNIEFDGGLWLYTCNSTWTDCTFVHFYHC